MNILLINHYAGSNRHGMEFRPYYLAREWVRMGHKVTIVAASYSHVRQIQPELERGFSEEIIDGIRYVWLKTPPYSGNGFGRFLNMISFVVDIYWYQKNILGCDFPDAVIASSTYPLDVFPARHIAKKFNAKLVYEVHDLWPLSPIELGGMSRWNPFIMLMQYAENFFCRHSDKVVSILPNTREHLEAHGMASYKFEYIPNGIVAEDWSSGPKAIPKEHRDTFNELKRKGFFIVVYAGAHGVANALDSLLESAKLLMGDRVGFVLVGDGPEKKRLQEIAAKETLSNVYFLSSVSKSLIPNILDMADVLYIGFRKERLYRFGVCPNKLFDYMMASKPIVCSIEAGNDPVREAGCGLSVPADAPEQVAEAILALRDLSPEQRADMGARGKDYVLRHHEYKGLAQSFLEVLR